MAIYYPPAFINAYMQEKISEYFSANPLDGFNGDTTMPFFPTSPTAISDFTEAFPNGNGQFAVYDRMFRMRRLPFPHIKSEQLLYYFYATSTNPIPFMVEVTQKVQDLLDRGDESAEDLNTWARDKQLSSTPLTDDNGNKLPLPFFHNIKIFQLQETRDIINFGTARTWAGNKIIIDYDWHRTPQQNPNYNPINDPHVTNNPDLPIDNNKWLPDY
jgi:hypothetical protein